MVHPTTRRCCVATWLVLAIFGLARCLPATEPLPVGKTIAREVVWDRELPTSDGRLVPLKEFLGDKATVVLFLSTECPISNGYIPTLNQLAATYQPQGVSFLGVYANQNMTWRQVADHRREYGVQFPTVKESSGSLAATFGATRFPEALVFDSTKTLRYQGRIDDRYVKRGGAVNRIHEHNLEEALQQVLLNQPVTHPRTEVVGCPIPKPAVPRGNTKSTVNYVDHVAPILDAHCVSCHRPGGIGPFVLQDYDQAVAWAEDIKHFTANRQMPPWLPKEGHGDFKNRRVISEEQIQTIASWVDGGTVAGDLSRRAPLPQFRDGWQLGEPDLVLKPISAFEIPAEGEDIYRCFVLPTTFAEDRYVSAFEVRPGNSRVVHHVIAFLDTSGRSQKLDDRSPGEGYATSAGYPGFLPLAGLGGWAPGNAPREMPAGMAKVLPANASVVLQVHYHPSGKPELDQTEIGLHFAKTPVTRTIRSQMVMPFGGPLSGMRIPANDSDYEVQSSLILQRDQLVLSITPHMHLLGKTMHVEAQLPTGEIVPLLSLHRWDFNWQETYLYREPVSLPKGTRIEMVARFDNSQSNPWNPHRPPKDVTWGESTVEEMCIAFLEVAPAAEEKNKQDLALPTRSEILLDALKGRLPQRRPVTPEKALPNDNSNSSEIQSSPELPR